MRLKTQQNQEYIFSTSSLIENSFILIQIVNIHIYSLKLVHDNLFLKKKAIKERNHTTRSSIDLLSKKFTKSRRYTHKN